MVLDFKPVCDLVEEASGTHKGQVGNNLGQD
jgi:hypothetical protein